jgi:hypothetical protein
MRGYTLCAIILLAWQLAGCSPVEDPTLFPEFDPATAGPPPDKPAVPANPLRNLFWGDLHIHTSLSTDAFTMGVRTLPDDAYYFTRGGTIEHGAGYPIRASRPLDFAAVTDHSEYIGVLRASDIDLPLKQRSLRERLLNDGPLSLAIAFIRASAQISGGDLRVDVEGPEEIMIDSWREIIAAAERHYDPGTFTTFVAYEWTSMPGEQNLHRNVVYRGTLTPVRPFSSLDSANPEDLWDALDAQREQGMDAISIPHNSNASNGLMYDRVSFSGAALDADYASQRLRNEPISEILQIKGTSDTHPSLSPEDEFADFEIMNAMLSTSGAASEPRGSYARDALRTGLELSHSDGFNPYLFGVIGSSDSHNASSSVEEDNHHGKLPMMDGTAGLRLGKSMLLPESYQRQRRWGSAGLAAVWAQENTRDSLFDAMRRRETYATSGPRILLRFFAGWDYEEAMMDSPDLLAAAYQGGVPMGGSLGPAAPGGAPRFALWAARDPQGANLDRLQVIKGWVDALGVSHEKIYDVAASGGRTPGPDGRLAPVGNTVDVDTASYSNSIGAEQLAVLWRDPDFDPDVEAFYYARAIEIPTPRWSTYDALKLGVEPPQPTTIRERAISSAIWYRQE